MVLFLAEEGHLYGGGGVSLLYLQMASVAILHMSALSTSFPLSYVAPLLALSVQTLSTSAFMLAYLLALCLVLISGFWRYFDFLLR